jgi:hypothetical protein
MKKYVFCAVVVGVCFGLAGGTATLTAENQNPTPAPPTTQPGTTPAFHLTPAQTIVGCLYREKDVPGREPTVVERAGVMEDYILADASVGTTGKPPATSKMYKMYKVEKIDDEKLKAHVGKKVEVTGRIEAEPDEVAPAAALKPDKAVASATIDLPEIEAVAIREVPGTCPAKPTLK